MNIKTLKIRILPEDLLLDYIECAKISGSISNDEVTFDTESDCYKAILEGHRRIMAERLESLRGSRGVGDTIAKVTEKLGIDKVMELKAKITKKPCNCHEKAVPDGTSRQEKLNKLFPYKTD